MLTFCATAMGGNSDYVIEGTLLTLPGLDSLPSDAWKPERTEYFAITYDMAIDAGSKDPQDLVGHGGVFGVRHSVVTRDHKSSVQSRAMAQRVTPAAVHLPSPVEELPREHESAIHLQLLGTDRILTVPATPWLPGELRSCMRALPAVYFDDAGDATLVRRTLPEPLSLGLAATVSVIEPGEAANTERALRSTHCSVEFENAHIEDVAAQLASQASVAVSIDPTAVAPRGGAGPRDCTLYATDGMIPYIKLHNVPLDEAIEAVCRPLNLRYNLRPGLVWITSKDRGDYVDDLERRANVAVVQLTTMWAALAGREVLPQASFLDIGRPTVREVNGIGWIPAPLGEWVLVTLQSVDETLAFPPQGVQPLRGDGGMYYALLIRVRALDAKEFQ